MAEERLPTDALSQTLSPQLFKALAEENRLSILSRLAQSGSRVTVSEIADGLPIQLSVVSRHLAILRDAEVVDSQRQGKNVYYWLRTRRLAQQFRRLAHLLEEACPER